MSKAKEHIDSKANFPPLGGSNRDRQTRKTSLREANFATAEGCDEAICLFFALCSPTSGLLRYKISLRSFCSSQ